MPEEMQKGAFLSKQAGDIIACFTNVLSNGSYLFPQAYGPDLRFYVIQQSDFLNIVFTSSLTTNNRRPP